MKKRFSLLALVVALFTLVLFTACGGTPAATLNKTELSMTVGTEFTLEAALTNVQEVTWESSDHKTVDVTADGKTAVVKALKAGTVTISVMNGEDVLATCEITVAESPLPPALQKMQPLVSSVPSLLGQVRPAFSAIL